MGRSRRRSLREMRSLSTSRPSNDERRQHEDMAVQRWHPVEQGAKEAPESVQVTIGFASGPSLAFGLGLPRRGLCNCRLFTIVGVHNRLTLAGCSQCNCCRRSLREFLSSSLVASSLKSFLTRMKAASSEANVVMAVEQFLKLHGLYDTGRPWLRQLHGVFFRDCCQICLALPCPPSSVVH